MQQRAKSKDRSEHVFGLSQAALAGLGQNLTQDPDPGTL
jgi:hypothetical protein